MEFIIKKPKKALIESYNSRGFFKSFEIGQSIKFDKPYPLLTNPFIDWIISWDLSRLNYLEIGSGASTIFFQKYFNKITSIEPSNEFYSDMIKKLNNNVTYQNIDKTLLEKGIFKVEEYYDFCLIDYNLNRFLLTENLLKKTKFAFLIFDTTEQYPNTSELIRNNGYTNQIDFWGFKNTQSWESCTSVFINDEIKIRLEKINRYSAPGAMRLYQNLEEDNAKI